MPKYELDPAFLGRGWYQSAVRLSPSQRETVLSLDWKSAILVFSAHNINFLVVKKTILQYNILVLAYMCKLTVQFSTVKIVGGPGQEAEPSLEAHNWLGTAR